MTRIRRRTLIGLGLAGIGSVALVRGVRARQRGTDAVTPIRIESQPIRSLLGSEPERRTFGRLTFRSGLVLTSTYDGFGGLSGLSLSPAGRDLVALSDNAQWLTARIVSADGRVVGLEDAVMAPILGQDGVPLRQGPAYDTEALAIADGVAYVGIERVHEVRRFAWAAEGFRARGIPLPVPAEVGRLPSNESLEALAVAPPGHPLAGAVVVIAERARAGDDAPTRGWVLTGRTPFAFDVARRDGFDTTDLAFLPSGEALLLERRYTVLGGVACRIRRFPRDAFRPDAMVDGETLFDVDRAHEIDNMEGLGIHRDPDSGETVLTLVSDDNFSPVQRTILLQFTLD